MITKTILTALIGAVTISLAAPAEAVQRRDDQNDARAQMMAGKVKSLRSIENRILPKMQDSEYLGPEFDPVAQVYRLKIHQKGSCDVR